MGRKKVFKLVDKQKGEWVKLDQTDPYGHTDLTVGNTYYSESAYWLTAEDMVALRDALNERLEQIAKEGCKAIVK